MNDHIINHSRRQFLMNTGVGLGAVALNRLLPARAAAENLGSQLSHFAPKAKRVIFLFMSGGPSQHDLFDYKPKLRDLYGQDLKKHMVIPRLSGMTSGKATFDIAPSMFDFKQHGSSGAWVSSLLPHTAKIVDDLCFVKSMTSTHVNHDPAVTFLQAGYQFPGRPSIGSWVSYGMGHANENLPAYMVLTSVGNYKAAQPLLSRLWGSGFLPSKFQGIKLRSGKNPILYLKDPGGRTMDEEKMMLDVVRQLNEHRYQVVGDPEIQTRITQYEMAARMQMSVPNLTDYSDESDSVFELYGEDARKPGTFASNCLLARRMIERDVRFVQLFHTGWDHHDDVAKYHPVLCKETDQSAAALVTDLKQRGLLDSTLVVWGGEFGRTVFSQGGLQPKRYGRDHHPYNFTYWLAGGGIKGGVTYGETDDFSCTVTKDPVEVHDLHATILHLLGFDHEQLTYKFQGRHFRLTDIHGTIVKGILS
ncbi:MAG TPA: DUF1501 domain-containing protein [Verrucomicrobiales bacterium]|nr:DUF1501 domain-containing protein [Verrucomicrobiales bacterium]HIL72059.1 DUF1501 domain-containing protein [Verrucomicrobiota bacterium]